MTFHDEFFCHIVRGDAGRLVAIAPLMRTFAPGVGPPLVRMLQFFGVDPALTEIRGVICAPEDQVPVIQALIEHFLVRRHEWDVFRWVGLRQSLEAYCAPRTLWGFTTRESLPDFVLDLPKSWDELRLNVSSNMRKNLRKCYEFLERDGFAVELRVTQRPDGVDGATERFLLLHAARADAVGMISHPNKFDRARERGFLAHYLRGAADRGELRIFELEINRTVVASRVAFLIGNDLYLYFAGYDPTLEELQRDDSTDGRGIQVVYCVWCGASEPVHRSRPVQGALEAARGAVRQCGSNSADLAGENSIRVVSRL